VTTATEQRYRPGQTVRILYVNAYGETSTRTLEIRETYTTPAGVTYLRAFCRLREQLRTFRTDRILAVLDPQPEPAGKSPAAAEAHTRRTAPPPVRQQERGERFPFRALVFAVLCVVVGVKLPGWLDGQTAGGHVPPAHAERITPQPAPVERWTLTYRGQQIDAEKRGTEVTYTLISSGHTSRSLQELRIAVNAKLLHAAWKLDDPRLAAIYGQADADCDGELEWHEIRSFQRELQDTFSYLANNRALTPVEFLNAGGGDCEDWAIMTAGLLRFWGRRAYIGSFRSEGQYHAVTLIPEEEAGYGSTRITVSGFAGIPDGTYVPIDYAAVGDFAVPVDKPFSAASVWVPQEIFGWHI